jgi:hypothetical protein
MRSVAALWFGTLLASFVGCRGDAGTRGRPDGRESIYGDDDRLEINDPENDPLVVEAGQSVALVIDWKYLQPEVDGFRVASNPYGKQENLCPGERFADQPESEGRCTAFLVAPSRVVTAGHCITVERCAETALVFGFAYRDPTDDVTWVLPDDVYGCQAVLARELSPTASDVPSVDYAILELDRPVPDRQPLTLRRESKLRDRVLVTLIDHPMGLPMKTSTGAVFDNSDPVTFNAQTDGFRGSSGSPVLDPATGLVEGVLIGVSPDWELREGTDCLVSHRCPTPNDEDCQGQLSMRSLLVSEALALLDPFAP